jgi:phosphoribosylformylglycinamidine synthase subunit PurS
MKSIITVSLKESILDPQGKAVQHAIEHMGYKNVKDLRIGKSIIMNFDSSNRSEVEKQTKEISEKLLINPVIETYKYEIEE